MHITKMAKLNYEHILIVFVYLLAGTHPYKKYKTPTSLFSYLVKTFMRTHFEGMEMSLHMLVRC